MRKVLIITSTLTLRTQFRSGLRILDHVLRALTGAYALSVLGFLILRAAVGESWSLLAFFNNFLLLLLLPPVVLLPFFLIRRQWLLCGLLLPILLLFIIGYGELFTARAADVSPEQPRLRLLTYNLQKDTVEAEPVLAVIRESDADVVALQELNSTLAEYFQTELADEYPYQALHPVDYYTGQGLLSRYPLTEDDYWVTGLGHQRVVIDFGETLITLYNAHAVHPFTPLGAETRGREIIEILSRAGQDTTPILIAGDFNITDLSDGYTRIAQVFTDTWREVGWGLGFTFPTRGSRLPLPVPRLARIDYVFHSDDWRGVTAQVWPESGGSDHRPLFVELALVD